MNHLTTNTDWHPGEDDAFLTAAIARVRHASGLDRGVRTPEKRSAPRRGAKEGTPVSFDFATFPDALRAFRVSAGVTQWRLAQRAGYDHSTVSRWESGDRQPTRESVEALADALGLHDGDRARLLASAGFADELPDVARFRALSAERRALLLAINDTLEGAA